MFSISSLRLFLPDVFSGAKDADRPGRADHLGGVCGVAKVQRGRWRWRRGWRWRRRYHDGPRRR